MIIEITPIPKPRMTQADRWKKRPCVLRYRAYCDALRLAVRSLPGQHHLAFELAMPKSWSEKKMRDMAWTPHTQKPDLDNLIKGFYDALFTDDAAIFKISAEKKWGYRGRIVITKC